MSDGPVVFANAYEALVRVLGSHLDGAVHKRFQAHGVDLTQLQAAYTLETWLESLKVTMDVLWPGMPTSEASYHLGRQIVVSYGNTMMGKALMQMLRVLGPERGLGRMARNLRTTNNYSDTKVTKVADKSFELWVNIVAHPGYFCGLLEAGLIQCGAKGVHVAQKSYDQQNGGVFLVEWQ